MSSTATPMWSILPNIGAQSTWPAVASPAAVALAAVLDAEDLGQRRDADLELLGRRLLGRQVALDLAAGRVERLGQRGAVVAVAPGEHLHRERGAAEADRGARQRARPLDQPLQQHRAAGGEQHHRRDQVGAAAVVLLGHRRRVLDPLLVGGDRLVLDPVVGGQVAVAEGDHGRHRPERLHDPLAQRRARHPAAQRGGRDQRRPDRGKHPPVLEGQPRRRQPPPHQRQHRHRLGQFQRPPQPRHPPGQLRRQLGFPLGGDHAPRRPRSRTAAAQCVGPWISRPLRSAMPPSRSFSGHRIGP